MISDAGLEYLRKRFDGFTSLSELRRYWQDDIGKNASRDPRVIAFKDEAKERLDR